MYVCKIVVSVNFQEIKEILFIYIYYAQQKIFIFATDVSGFGPPFPYNCVPPPGYRLPPPFFDQGNDRHKHPSMQQMQQGYLFAIIS